MINSSFLELIQNAALLMAIAVLFDLIGLQRRMVNFSFRLIVFGFLLGTIGIFIMMSPWVLAPGIIFDTRSILLCISGLFFGPVPTIIAVIMTALFRIYQGGTAAAMGVSVIITSASIGILWRQVRRRPLEDISWRELYLLGILVHIIMLLCTFVLPIQTALRILSAITIPVILIYPVGTILIGLLLARSLFRERATEQLQEGKERLALAIKTANIGFFDRDLTNNRETFSPEWKKQIGYEEDEISDSVDEWENRLHPDDLENALLRADTCIQGGKTEYESEFRLRHKNGTYRWFLARGLIHFDANSKPVRLLGSHIDITSQKEHAASILESERRFHGLAESSQDSIFLLDSQCRYVYVNPAGSLSTGLNCEDLIGKTPLESGLNVEFAEILQKEIRQVFTIAVHSQRLAEIDSIHGKQFFDIRLSPVLNVKGEVDLVLIISRNISDQKQTEDKLRLAQTDLQKMFIDADQSRRALLSMLEDQKTIEENLRESNSRFQQLTDNILEVFWLIDAKTNRILYENPAFENLWGISAKKLFKDPESLLNFIYPEDVLKVTQEELRLHNEARDFDQEYRIVRPDGTMRWVHSRIYPVKDIMNQVVRYAGIAEDITERKRTQTDLQNRSQELETLFSISKHLRAAQNQSEILELVVNEILKIIPADGIAINSLDPDGIFSTVELATGILSGNTGKRHHIQNSRIEEILVSNDPIVISDYAIITDKDPELISPNKIGPYMIVLIQSEVGPIGAITSTRKQGKDVQGFTTEEVHLMVGIAELLGSALRRARLFDQAITRLDQVQSLHEIDIAINMSLDQDLSLQTILNKTITHLHVDEAVILLLNPNTLMLEYYLSTGSEFSYITKNIQIRLGESISGRAALEHRVINIPDLLHQNEYQVKQSLLDSGIVEMHSSPMIIKGQVRGVLEVFSRSICVHDSEDIAYLEALAAQAAIAINNAQMFTDLERSNLELQLAYDATIEGWSLATDLRDKETEGHSLRVTAMAIKLAELLKFPPKEINQLRRGALLHDIGKIAIPDSILLKPGPLTEDEWIVMRQHPVKAREMLDRITFLQPALAIPYSHHEKYDGTGYPQGLSTENIPLAARIFAVIDVWDALRSDRPYRPAWSKEQAVEYIQEQSGKHFDPQVTSVFLQYLSLITE